jgi:hypothetical protein
MSVFRLIIVGVLVLSSFYNLINGIAVFKGAQTVFHWITGLEQVIIGVILLCAAICLEVLESIRKALEGIQEAIYEVLKQLGGEPSHKKEWRERWAQLPWRKMLLIAGMLVALAILAYFSLFPWEIYTMVIGKNHGER